MKTNKFKVAFDAWIEQYYPNAYDLPLYFINMLKMEFINTKLEGYIKIEHLGDLYWAEVKCNKDIIKFSHVDHLKVVSGAVERFVAIYNE